MKKLILLLLTSALMFASASPTKVDINKAVIQLGVFKNIENVKKLQKRFGDYNFFVKDFPSGVKKAYIINIQDSKIDELLSLVRQTIPNAFLLNKDAKYKVFKNLSLCRSQIASKEPKVKSSEQKTISFESSSCLDSKAIIKTRKKFFK